jgi:formiminotetrahydrofolate cyclodeaminase
LDMLVEQSVREFLAGLASPGPTPGGGSASALAAAIGTSLLMMVASLPRTRTGAPEERDALSAASSALGSLQRHLAEAIDADAAAYDQVVAARRMPRATPADRAARSEASHRALIAATNEPLRVMRWSADALELAEPIAAHGQRAAASDVGVAIAMLEAAFRGARLNVETNLRGLTDATYTNQIGAEVKWLVDRVARSIEAAAQLLAR